MSPKILERIKRCQAELRKRGQEGDKLSLEALEVISTVFKSCKKDYSKLGELQRKYNELEQENLRLNGLKDPFYDLLQLIGVENYAKFATNVADIKLGKTKVVLSGLISTKVSPEVLVVAVERSSNIAYGIVTGGKYSDELVGLLVKFNLNASHVVENVIKRTLRKLFK